MTQIEIIKECRFCSEASKTNGEDPIGNAGHYNHFLFIELPEPWSENCVYEHPHLGVVHKMAKSLKQEQGIYARVMAIAPDSAYSIPNQTRVLHYQRPAGRFAQFEKQEFLISQDAIIPLATALLMQPEQLSQFNASRQDSSHLRDMVLCTHGSYDMACGKFGYPIYRQLRSSHATPSLRVWRCTHLGPHHFAPLLIDFPEGRYWGRLRPEMLDLLIHHNDVVAQLYPFYVGWAGLGWAEQIAEREIWMQVGWDWLNYHKSGQVLALTSSPPNRKAV
jgi:hypothetical protein